MFKQIWDVIRAVALGSLICVSMIIFWVIGPILLFIALVLGGMLVCSSVLYLAFAQARADKLKQEEDNHKDL